MVIFSFDSLLCVCVCVCVCVCMYVQYVTLRMCIYIYIYVCGWLGAWKGSLLGGSHMHPYVHPSYSSYTGLCGHSCIDPNRSMTHKTTDKNIYKDFFSLPQLSQCTTPEPSFYPS